MSTWHATQGLRFLMPCNFWKLYTNPASTALPMASICKGLKPFRKGTNSDLNQREQASYDRECMLTTASLFQRTRELNRSHAGNLPSTRGDHTFAGPFCTMVPLTMLKFSEDYTWIMSEKRIGVTLWSSNISRPTEPAFATVLSLRSGCQSSSLRK